MPQLIKKIEGELITDITNEIELVNSIIGLIQEEDYINMGWLICFLQDYTQTKELEILLKPYPFGLKNKYNLEVITLNVDK